MKMKTIGRKWAAAAMALAAGVVTAGAVEPVLDNLPGAPGQSRAYWEAVRAEAAAKKAAAAAKAASTATATAQTAQAGGDFFTGKPYDADLGGYVFKYRIYDPDLGRWTTPDPSGFPDGANGWMYAPNPMREVDPLGLLKWDTLEETGRTWDPSIRLSEGGPAYDLHYNEFSITANDGTTALRLYQFTGSNIPSPLAVDFSYNCAGYAFASSDYWINSIPEFGTPSLEALLKAEGYKKVENGDYSNARFALWGNAHIAMVTSANQTEVTEVRGKRGGELGLVTSAPGEQWRGESPSSYWE